MHDGVFTATVLGNRSNNRNKKTYSHRFVYTYMRAFWYVNRYNYMHNKTNPYNFSSVSFTVYENYTL